MSEQKEGRNERTKEGTKEISYSFPRRNKLGTESLEAFTATFTPCEEGNKVLSSNGQGHGEVVADKGLQRSE